MATVILYDSNGNKFTAPDEEVAKAAIKSGDYFETPPTVNNAAALGLVPVDQDTPIRNRLHVDPKSGLTRLYDLQGKAVSMRPVDANEALRTGTFFLNPPQLAETKKAQESVARAAKLAALKEVGADEEAAEVAAQEAIRVSKTLTEQVAEANDSENSEEAPKTHSRRRSV